MTLKDVCRVAFGAGFIASGSMHFANPEFFRGMMPPHLPAAALVAVSGVAEIAGGLGLMLPRFRRAAGIGLILLLIAVFPANIEMLLKARDTGVSPAREFLLWLRLPIQGLLILWAWQLSRRPNAVVETAPA